MALYPNGRHMTRSTYKGYGVAPGLDAYIKGLGDSRNRFIALNKTASTPDGYGMRGSVPPITAGSMSSHRQLLSLSGSGNVLAGGPMTGSSSVLSLTGSGNLSLTVGLSGTSLVCFLTKQTAQLALTIGLSGSGSISFSSSGALSMIVPFSGTGSILSMIGSANLKGLLSLSGEFTPFTELSPENLAAAVWEHATRTLTSGGGGVTADELLNDPRMLTLAKFLGLK